MSNHADADASCLHSLNPLAKLIATCPVTFFLTLTTNIWTPIVFIIFSSALTLLFGRISPLRYAKMLVLLLPFVAGFILTYSFMIGGNGAVITDPLLTAGALSARESGALFGLATGLRLLSLYTLMLLFTLTTDSSEFVRALVQQWRLNDRFGYVILAVMRFIPDMRRQYLAIRWARKVRGLSQKKGLLPIGERVSGSMLPLLASAVRQAERASLSMEARAFGAFPRRTYYRKMTFRMADWLFVAAFWLLSGLWIGLLDQYGLLGTISFLKMFA
ncbi:energy-coupling factor transporter transmembrane component T family protein [Paenibacillus tyrfis]|uniref:Cobalt transporter n=1 Tax=Paenibacillus tyrfis TaxID=1501230 RepID=A0A081NXH7_9BACL|nr:energy-coupling factor transporter transmembrane component T [Paenibacillus tyrfis]KEQ23150.1 hypothetical protein ET33_17405 [Paenibacillus tyrfis]